MAEPDASVPESLRRRFPEDDATVRDLIARDTTFAALCREYRRTEEQLQELRQEHARIERELPHLRQRRDHIEKELEHLPQRQEQIEAELLTRIEGYTPR